MRKKELIEKIKKLEQEIDELNSDSFRNKHKIDIVANQVGRIYEPSKDKIEPIVTTTTHFLNSKTALPVTVKTIQCGKCLSRIEREWKICPYCGIKVKEE